MRIVILITKLKIFFRNIDLKNIPEEFIDRRCRQADFKLFLLKISLSTPQLDEFLGEIFQIDISGKNHQFCDQYNIIECKKNETVTSEHFAEKVLAIADS